MRLGGVSEVADELGVSPQRMRALRTSRDSTFPTPVADLSSGQVWDLDEIAAWNAGRRGPGRPPLHVLGGRFELEPEPIGSGGFADVFRAVDRQNPAEVVAVKVLRQVEHGDGVDRFQRELRLLQELSHPNVIPVLGAGVDGKSRPWYAMPLAVGNLHDVLGEIGGEEEVIDVMLQVCAGLEYLHTSADAEGVAIFHRDLCPRNILRTSGSTWAIADFGLAREAERRSIALTNSSMILGHIQYLAPEQLSGLKGAEAPADIYSVGRTLQAMVLGRDPVVGERYEEDNVFRPIIKKSTRQDPGERYRSVREIIADLQAVQLAPREQWEPPEKTMERLKEKVREAGPISQRTLEELCSTIVQLRDDPSARREGALALPSLTQGDLGQLYNLDPTLFASAMETWAQALLEGSFSFDFCDELADVGERAVLAAKDNDEVLSSVLRALVYLGWEHNRWHVRSVVVRILQRIRERDEALVAVDALRSASPIALAWTLRDFALQSLHPLIRDGLGSP